MTHLFNEIYGCEAADARCDIVPFDDSPLLYRRRNKAFARIIAFLPAHRPGGAHMGYRA